MKYKYTGGTDGAGYVVGLPARDLDDKELTVEEKWLLDQGVAAGIYEPVTPKKKVADEQTT